MADLESTLSEILSDPEAVSRIRDLGKSLGLTGDTPAQDSPQKEQSPLSGPDLSSLSSLTSLLGAGSSQNTENADLMKKFTSFLPILTRMNSEDEATALLRALRPFLSEEKRKRLDDASKMLKVMRILPLIRSTGLF